MRGGEVGIFDGMAREGLSKGDYFPKGVKEGAGWHLGGTSLGEGTAWGRTCLVFGDPVSTRGAGSRREEQSQR